MILFLIIEFSYLFFFDVLNNYMEKEYKVYFSEYKRKEQYQLLRFLGFRDIKNAKIYGYQPNSIRTHLTKEFKYSYMTNELGLRGKLPPLQKDSNEFRIVILGDSFAEGFGAPNDSTLSFLLQKNLDKSYNTSNKVIIINGGICGSNPIYQVQLYNNLLVEYKPNMVIMMVNSTDINDLEYVLNSGTLPINEYFNAVSHLWRAWYFAIFNSEIDNSKSSKRIRIKRQKNINEITNILRKFKSNLEVENINFFVIYHPVLDEIAIDYYTYKPSFELVSTLLKNDMLDINLIEDFKKMGFIYRNQTEQYYWVEDGHFNGKGYNLIANIISKKLVRNIDSLNTLK